MSIKKFAVGETATIELKDVNDEVMKDDSGKVMKITVYGPGSKQYAAAESKRLAAMLATFGKKSKANAPKETQETKAEFLAECTVAFENIEYDGLKGRELYMAVYRDRSLGFVTQQVENCINDWANFTQPAAKA